MARLRGTRLWLLLLVLALLGWGGVLALGRPARTGPRPSAVPAVAVEVRADVEVVAEGRPGLARAAVIPRLLLLTPGEVVRLRAEGYDARGRRVAGVEVRWELADPAAGTLSRDGIYRAPLQEGRYPGAVRVRLFHPATGTRAEAAADVVVRAPGAGAEEPRALQVYPDPVTVLPGEEVRVYAVALDGQGRPVPSGAVLWRVVDPRAGSVTPEGRFTGGTRPGRYPGALEASLAGTGLRARVDVVVRDEGEGLEGARAYIVPDPILLRPGREVQLVAGAVSGGGEPLPVRGVRWILRNPEAGSLSPGGRFRASDRAGEYPEAVEVEVEVPGGTLRARAAVRVLPERPPGEEDEGGVGPARVVVEPRTLILRPGASRRLTAVVLDPLGRPLPEAGLRWEVVDPRAGRVTPQGLFTAGDRPGRYENALRAVAEAEGVTVRTPVTVVVTGRLARAEVRPDRVRLAPGEAVRFRVVAYDEAGNVLPDVRVEWSVADPRAGSIDAAGRFVAGRTPGLYPGAVIARVVQPAP